MEEPTPRFRASSATHEGEVRDHNEDTPLVADDVRNENGLYHLWAVADGMGGGARGEEASRIAIETLEAVLRAGDWHNPKDALREAFLQANASVFERGTAGGQATRSLMGTTLVAALVEEATGHAWVANVGDSRAYLIRASEIAQRTQDHSLVAERVRAGLMTAAEARTANERNIITRAVGIEASTIPDVFDWETLEPGDQVLLCSDGLHGMIPEERLLELATGSAAPQAVDALVQAAREAGGHDNITVVIGGDGAANPGHFCRPLISRKSRLPVALAGSAALCLTAAVALLAYGLRGESGGAKATPSPAPQISAPLVQTAVGTSTATPTPSPEGREPRIHTVTVNDGSCEAISKAENISVQRLLELNPDINATCSNLVPGMHLKVEGPP